ncbi:hypothetical protein AB0I53_13460 [Saccharopolyspora sp. NPDC050389]|uniref:hypothetical protein n=1 Tax=Saccharopolyspora sp. NPDC050389 TaxID=3155516 RepID=UPI00340155E1
MQDGAADQKSSFYWLFDNRQALVDAALERWERVETDEVIPRLAAVADPAERLRLLVETAFSAGRSGTLALRLLVDTVNPAARSVAERVTRKRIASIEEALAELGRPADQARHLAAAYAIYLGTATLNSASAAPEDTKSYVDTVLESFGVPANR